LNLVNSLISPKLKESWDIGLNSLKLGIMISISFIAVAISEFVIKTYIIRTSGVETVGLYQAGWALNVTYLGMVFTAMATDFYPRLSINASDNALVKQKVNQQAEIALLIIGPLIAMMFVALPLLIKVLYSTKFISIIEMTRLLLIGSLLKSGSWAISFIFLAKGNGKLYLFNELGVRFFTLPIYLILFHFFGLKGIGWAFIIDQSIYFIWVLLAAWVKYNFKYSPEFYRILFICISSNIMMLIFTGGIFQHLTLFLSICCGLIISCYSLYKLNEKIGFLVYMKEKFIKKN
jgi:O-antigen/teichoic acid export membrane protein